MNEPQTLIDEALRYTIDQVYRRPRTLKSDFTRKHAVYIAMAASMQMISTRIEDGLYGNKWRVTAKGLRWLRETE